ncbi:MAG: phosphopantothenoylcysteine decarboxylase [Spirochaetales bacterium]|nr:phosphopantothenoylcysteine decarboxylase [Spirochaetales bacterium]
MQEKSILIAVTGSIAAYKSCELVRSLVKRDLPVSVLMTANATRFVGPLTFEILSGQKVYTTDWDEGMLHIEVKNRARLLVVAPATANILAKMAQGIADDLVSTTALALNCPILVAPAMNPNMYRHPATRANLELLRSRGVHTVGPDGGEVICKDAGQGKMSSVAEIEETILRLL